METNTRRAMAIILFIAIILYLIKFDFLVARINPLFVIFGFFILCFVELYLCETIQSDIKYRKNNKVLAEPPPKSSKVMQDLARREKETR